MSLKNVYNEDIRKAAGNICLGPAGLAEGTNANTIQIATAIDYCIDGIFYAKGITNNIAMTANDQQADLTECMYLISIDSAGNVTTTKGEEKATSLAESVYLPDLPDGDAPVGAIKVVTNGGTFTSGSTDLGAAHVTDTFYDMSGVSPNGF